MEDLEITPKVNELLHTLHTHKTGLSSSEAHHRLQHLGKNVLVDNKRKTLIVEFLSKFKNPLIIILIVASLVSFFTESYIDTVIILLIILISVVLDFYQEYQSQQAADKLKARVSLQALVMRDGTKTEIPVSHLTVGDIVYLSTGDVVPADIIIMASRDLHIDESTFTGESFPAEKHDMEHIFMGSTVANGEATGVVTNIGKDTKLGRIADKLSMTRPEGDFEKGMKQFGFLISKITIVLVVIIFLINAVFKQDILGSFLFALALAVGLTPELLPMIITVNLSKGAMRMAKKGVIVKHLPSIQNFGSMNILCTDKTGTITENKIRLELYEDIHEDESSRVLEYGFYNSHFQSNMKSPLDDAILAHKHVKVHHFTKVDEVPFDFVRRRLSVVIEDRKGKVIVTKGAPESVFSISSHYDDNGQKVKFSPTMKRTLKKRFQELSGRGFRVLAVAYKHLRTSEKVFNKRDETDMVFLGFMAFLDPPKESVKPFIKSLYEEGVLLKIITGDNELVSRKVCEELDVPITGILLGEDVRHMPMKTLSSKAAQTTIFARMNPEEKNKVILALKRNNNVVGYMGDGVNDAISLRSADIGISVENAVDVAKESADIILTHKSLQVLREGVMEGRKTFMNTLKYIFMAMGSNFGNMFSISFASIFLSFLPMLPIQILLNNLMYDISQLSLPTDNVDDEAVKLPLRWDFNFMKRFIFIFGPLSSLFDFITFYVLLVVFHATVPFFRSGWFVESLITQSLVIFVVRTRKVPFFRSKPSGYVIFSTFFGIVLAILITQTFVGRFFDFVPLSGGYWIYMIGVVFAYVILAEMAKVFFYRSFIFNKNHIEKKIKG
jgi:Mg2+-importing ATPase